MANEKVFKPDTYMELAIEEMNKSQNEPRPDGKIPLKLELYYFFLMAGLFGLTGEN